MSKYSLFGVNIHPEITHNKNNILKVSSKKEIFYDIFECSFNNKKIIVEKIGEFENKPLVEFKLNKGGKVLNCQALLEVGKDENLILKESESAKKIRIITEEKKAIAKQKKIKNELIIEKKKAIAKQKKIEQESIIKEERLRMESIANEAIKLLDEKQKLDQAKRLEEAKKVEEVKKLLEEKLLKEKLLKEKLDAQIKKMNERLKIKEEKEKIEQEKIRLQEEAKQLEEIKLLEEKRKLKEEIIRNSPFYTDGNAYAIDVNAKYKYIKITNGTTGAEKIFKSKGEPRKVVLNKNLLSYNNILNYDYGDNINYTIDIETEEIVKEKYIEPEMMGGSAWDPKLFINQKTIINILWQTPSLTSSTVETFSYQSNILDIKDDINFRNYLLSLDVGEAFIDTNVNINHMDLINADEVNSRPSFGASARLNGITATKNSIALGGLDMANAAIPHIHLNLDHSLGGFDEGNTRENMLWKGAGNVINIMFQNLMPGFSYTHGGTFPDDYEGEVDDYAALGLTREGGYFGSINFLKDGLRRSRHNRAIFYQVGAIAPGGIHNPGSSGPTFKAALQELEASFVDTIFEERTEFHYETFEREGADYAAHIGNQDFLDNMDANGVSSGKSNKLYEEENPGRNYYADIIVEMFKRQVDRSINFNI